MNESISAGTRQELFRNSLMTLLVRRVRQWKHDGTVSMGRDCAWSCVAAEASRLPGAPVGTNSAYMARQVFNDLVSRNPFFVIRWCGESNGYYSESVDFCYSEK